MEKYAIIKIETVDLNENSIEFENMMPAQFETVEDINFVKYTEYDKETNKKTNVVLEFDENYIKIKKTGLQEMDIFVKNEEYLYNSMYVTEYGSFPLEVRSLGYECEVINGLYLIDIKYNLKTQDQLIGDLQIKIKILVKDEEK